MAAPFSLRSDHTPRGDQPAAIEALTQGLAAGERDQVLLGITGSGKTFTIANVIARSNRSALVLAPNKTLAAQLYGELRELFPDNAVEYFVSYYDYYQPEAYVAASDTFIEKDAIVNDRIDRMRHSATRSLLSRKDVIIVASVSCIYGIGSAEWYEGMLIRLERGMTMKRDELLRRLVDVQYERNDVDFHRGTFRVRGDVVEVFPAHAEDRAIRIEFWGDELDRISEIDPLRGTSHAELDAYGIYPSSHYVTPDDQRRKAIESIRAELRERLVVLEAEGKLVERQRLEQRTSYDLEMLEQMGFCHGIENYSRHLSNRTAGEPPPTLLDYLPKDFLLVVDESHQTIPQVAAMFRGDRARKETLVAHGFRLPSALDNRPLTFEEFEARRGQTLYVSATPGQHELDLAAGVVVEQVIRPTGLLDPLTHVRPVLHQVDDLLKEIRVRVERKERVLVTTLTKRMAEDLTEYYGEVGVRVRYLHSDVDTLERIEILRDLRRGDFDVLVGINLLREGLDIPECSLVAILDADREGFLRSPRSLIQTIGRAARNANGEVILYADRVTPAMAYALSETERRRTLQTAYNEAHGITPRTVTKALFELDASSGARDYVTIPILDRETYDAASRDERIELLRAEMLVAAEALEFEKAAKLRDELLALETDQRLGKPERARKASAASATSASPAKAGAKGPSTAGTRSGGRAGAGGRGGAGGRPRRGR